eukprot:jgi/Mesvir1/12256/Mv00472-RA.1
MEVVADPPAPVSKPEQPEVAKAPEPVPAPPKEPPPKWAVLAKTVCLELRTCFGRIATAIDGMYEFKGVAPLLPAPALPLTGQKKKKRQATDENGVEKGEKKRREMTKFNLFVKKEMEYLREKGLRSGESQQNLMKEVCQKWRVAPENPRRALPGAPSPDTAAGEAHDEAHEDVAAAAAAADAGDADAGDGKKKRRKKKQKEEEAKEENDDAPPSPASGDADAGGKKKRRKKKEASE